MAEPYRLDDLHALRNLIDEALTLLDIELPEGRGARAREVLKTALALNQDLIAEPPAKSQASELGKLGGAKTAQRGADYFREIAAQRKTKAGGRPRTTAQ